MARRHRRAEQKNGYIPEKPEVTNITPKTQAQRDLMVSIRDNPITIASGCAGVGKNLIAVYMGMQLLEYGKVDKILYIKPVVDMVGERGVGFLKGDVDEKLEPLIAPIRDNLEVFCSPGKINIMMNKKQIEVGLLEYLRGRSLRRTFVIFDEVQNSTKHGVLTVISRLEDSSKLVILGDLAQSDTGNNQNGLADALVRLRNLDCVGMVNFTAADIVRSSFLAKVIARYQ